MDVFAQYAGKPEIDTSQTLSDLRLALIGNNDLKVRLVADENFLSWFSNLLRDSVDALSAARHPNMRQIHEIHTHVIVLRILVSFVGSSPLQDSEQCKAADSLRFCVLLLSKLIRYVLDTNLPELTARSTDSSGQSTPELAEAVDNAVCDAFHVLVVLANVLRSVLADVDFDAVWRLLSVLMMLTNQPNAAFFRPKLEKVLVSGLKMVPFCLERCPRDITLTYLDGLLSISLARLFDDLLAVYNATALVDVDPANSNTYTHSTTHRLLDDTCNMTALTGLTVAVVQMLNYRKEIGKTTPLPIEERFFTTPDIYQSALILLRYDGNKLLNVVALNLVRFNLAFLEKDSESEVSTIFEKIFPRIIELLKFNNESLVEPHPKYVQLPIAILSDLCFKNPSICVHLRNTNVDFKIMQELERLFVLVPMFRQLHSIKIAAARSPNKLADLTCLRRVESDHDVKESQLRDLQLDVISSYLLLLSVFTGSNEEFRKRMTLFKNELSSRAGPNFLCLMIYEIIEDYRFLIDQLILSYSVFSKYQRVSMSEKFLSLFGSNIGVLFTLLEHPIFSHTLYLIRSLSRSVLTLRTFFVDCNSIKSPFDEGPLSASEKNESIVDAVAGAYDKDISFESDWSFISSMLHVLSLLENVNSVMSYFTSGKSDYSSHRCLSRKSLAIKKVMLLACIANFILDFSSFRFSIINHETFLQDLALIYKNALAAKQEYDHSESRDEDSREAVFEQLTIQLGVLELIKNYLYNEIDENRKFVWDFIPLSMIFDKSLYGIIDESDEDPELHRILLLHKIIAFEIMRNLTAASAYFSKVIKESYLEYLMVKHQEGKAYVPKSWNDYLLENLMSFDLFVDVEGDRETIEKRFFSDDEFLLNLVKSADYVRLVVGINYLEDHRYTNILTFRKSDFPRSNLLEVWKRFLGLKLLDKLEDKICGLNVNERVRLSNQLSEIKVSIDWILINITWEDDSHWFQMPDKVNFRLLDTVSAQTQAGNASSSNLFSSSSIVIEESEDEDSEEGKHSEPVVEDENAVLTPQARAKVLNKHGFSNVLQKMIYEMSTPKYEPTRMGRRSPLERFDNLNANDLYEKSKTAHYQIISLISGTQGELDKSLRAQLHKTKQKHPLRRSSNIISSRDGRQIRSDIADEGNSSIQDYMGYEMEDRDNGNDTEAGSGENEDEEIDEYWIR